MNRATAPGSASADLPSVHTPVNRDDGVMTARPSGESRDSLEERLRQAQKMEAIGRLAGGVAHDFNNLLTIINGFSDVLLKLLGNQEPAAGLLREIQRAGDRAAALTRQLLTFSHKQFLQSSVLDLNSLVSGVEMMLRRLIGEDIQLVTALHPQPLPVRGDAGQFEQILMNLVVNARDAMPTGGKLSVATRAITLTADRRPALQEIPPGCYAQLTVTDTGMGMDAAVKAHLFEPFFTTKERHKGTGLGLATVYGIVQQNNGQITVWSEPGQGAEFSIYLPLVEEALTVDPVVEAAPIVAGGAETVLLVEDEEGVRSLVRQVLQTKGYQVLAARHGLEALSCCSKHRGPIQLVITDVVMPILGGVELVERLTRRYPQIKALYMSGHSDSALLRHGVKDRQVAYLCKPFTASELTQKVRSVLDHSSMSASNPA